MRKLCVLVAEDNEDQRHLYTMMLRIQGFEVRSVANGKEALKELQRSPPDVVLTDISMPDMDGMELLKLVKETEELAHVPIVVMTGFEKGYLTWAWAAGANETIAKPFTPEDLYTAILSVLPASPGH